MSYEHRAYDRHPGDPVIVLVVSGSHDVSRLLLRLATGNCEQVDVAESIRRQVRRHNGGRAAMSLLAQHGGPDLLTTPETDDSAEAERKLAAELDAAEVDNARLRARVRELEQAAEGATA